MLTYKITFKLVINLVAHFSFLRCELFDTFTNISSSEYFHYIIFIHEKFLENYNDKFQENLSRPGIIDTRAWYRAAARGLRNTNVEDFNNKRFIQGPPANRAIFKFKKN